VGGVNRHGTPLEHKVGQNCIYTLYITVYSVIFLAIVPYLHRMYKYRYIDIKICINKYMYIYGSGQSKYDTINIYV